MSDKATSTRYHVCTHQHNHPPSGNSPAQSSTIRLQSTTIIHHQATAQHNHPPSGYSPPQSSTIRLQSTTIIHHQATVQHNHPPSGYSPAQSSTIRLQHSTMLALHSKHWLHLGQNYTPTVPLFCLCKCGAYTLCWTLMFRLLTQLWCHYVSLVVVVSQRASPGSSTVVLYCFVLHCMPTNSTHSSFIIANVNGQIHAAILNSSITTI